MWHLREISYDEVPIDILSHGDRELRFVTSECNIFEDFFDSYGIPFLIWYLDSDEPESWDRCLDSYGFCLECEREIFFESFDFCQSDSLRWSESILDYGRADTLILHLDIDAELEKCPLYEE